MSRSFTIDKIEKVGGGKINYTEGRFKSESPSAAVRKMFTKAYHHARSKGPLSLKISLHETTQGSNKKVYRYRVTRKADKTEVEYKNETVVYNFSTKVKSL